MTVKKAIKGFVKGNSFIDVKIESPVTIRFLAIKTDNNLSISCQKCFIPIVEEILKMKVQEIRTDDYTLQIKIDDDFSCYKS